MAGILIASGPSGAGKSTLLKYLKRKFPELYFSISCTTRSPREGERDGKNYHFISHEEFKRRIENDEFLEYAQVHGQYYGTLLAPIEEAVARGRTVLFDIDVQGFLIVKEKLKGKYLSVFITTKNMLILKERLELRGLDSSEQIEKRLKNALEEMKHIGEYDFLIVNKELDDAKRKMTALCRAVMMKIVNSNSQKLISRWEKGE